ncbi:MAG: ABC transporter permease [Rhizobiales bacterium]|nr:ABC transporter permease [Hyphomicrobiales bacterium]
MRDAPSPDRPVLQRTGAKDRTLAASASERSSRWLASLQIWVAIILLAIVFGSALLAAFVTPYDPNEIGLDKALQAPSVQHWFGTDQLGRDVLSRVIWGGQVSLFLAACAVALAGAFGTLLGLVAGYFGGAVDRAVMWIADVQFSLPAVILALVLVGAVGPSFTNIVVVLSLANWARFARVIRSEALSLKSRDFVLLAKLGGASPLRIIAYHILPNVLGTFIVLATLDVGLIIILEATLSFLGLGVQPPDPSWGTMIADGRGYLERAWWISVFPGLALMATVLSGNLLGDALRDRLNPSQRRRW